MSYVFGLHGSREAAVQAEALEAKVLDVSKATYETRGSDPTVL